MGLLGVVAAGALSAAKKYLPWNLRDILADLDLQNKNKFDFVIARMPKLSLSPSAVTSALGAITDIIVSTLYVTSITIPSNTWEVEPSGDAKYMKSVTYPEAVTITFLEDEYGTVRRFLTEWEDSIGSLTGRGTFVENLLGTGPKHFVFKDDQESAKRLGMLLLQSKTRRVIPFYPRIMFHGLRIQKVDEMTIGHAEKENVVYSVLFGVDYVEMPLIF